MKCICPNGEHIEDGSPCDPDPDSAWIKEKDMSAKVAVREVLGENSSSPAMTGKIVIYDDRNLGGNIIIQIVDDNDNILASAMLTENNFKNLMNTMAEIYYNDLPSDDSDRY